MSEVIITRRNALVGTAAGVLAAAAPVVTNVAQAKADLMGTDIPVHARFKLGDFDVTTLLAGSRAVPGDPQGTFAMNVDKAEFEKVSKEHFLPTDVARFYFTPTVVNTGNELVLFDAGLGGETPGVLAALSSAGYTADQIKNWCWSHGFTGNATHDSRCCCFPKEDHKASPIVSDHGLDFWRLQ